MFSATREVVSGRAPAIKELYGCDNVVREQKVAKIVDCWLKIDEGRCDQFQRPFSFAKRLKGKFDSTQDPSGYVPVFGSVASVDPNCPNFIPVAFSAAWPAGKDYGPSVTSYTGQYTNENGQEQIQVIFLLANQVESTALWQSTSIASDVFKRTHP